MRVLLLVVAACIAAGSATLSAQDGDLRVACLPDKAVALPTDDVTLNLWVASSSGPVTDNVAVQWRVSAGQIERQLRSARWTLAGAPVERRQTATADVQVNGVAAGTCSVGVWVVEPPAASAPGSAPAPRLRGEYITRRAFIRTGQVGEQGFGLYSYFLMREPASPSEKSRAAAFVAAFLDVLVAVADQENYVERRQLNGSYMPVTNDLPQGLTVQQRAAWALDHYDYEHAKRLLSLYPTLTGTGPFILAVPAPLRTPIKPMLPWDFSQLSDAAIPEGIGRFLNQAAQLYDWQNQNALPKLRDQLLTAVAGMFVGRAAAENWLSIVR